MTANISAVSQPAELDVSVVRLANLAERRQIAALDQRRLRDELRLRRGRLPSRQPVGGEQRDHDSERVRQRVPGDRLRREPVEVGGRDDALHRLDGGGQRRGVGHPAGEDPGGDGSAEGEETHADCDRHGGGRRQAAEHEEVRPDAAAAEGGEESRAGLEADRVDEEREAEHPDRLGEHQPRVDRARGESREEHRRDPEREAGDPDPPEHESDGDDEEEQEHRVVGEGADHHFQDRPAGADGHPEEA